MTITDDGSNRFEPIVRSNVARINAVTASADRRPAQYVPVRQQPLTANNTRGVAESEQRPPPGVVNDDGKEDDGSQPDRVECLPGRG